MNQHSMTMPAYPQSGEVIDGKYQVERLLGEGGMGAVARATHLLRKAPVALKFMSPHVMAVSGAVERFLNEGVAASQIDSENVVKVFDVGRLANGAPYLVMECLDGQDLSELLQREGRPGLADIERSVHFVIQALRGLQVAHDAGIIHRDMKPSNCFVIQKDGEPDFVKLLDFGISKVKQQGGGHLTQTNSALGTPLYMSPEQAKSARHVDLRSDLYSCSIILYELLTGRTPFFSESGEFTEILFKIFTTEPPDVKTLRPDLPDGLAAAIMKGLAREPGDRYVDAADMAEALVPWADERSRQVVTRIRHRAANQGRPTNVPLSELGSQSTNQSMAAGPRAVITPYAGSGAVHGSGKLTPAEALANTRYSSVPSAPGLSQVGGDTANVSAGAGGADRTAMSASNDTIADGARPTGTMAPKTPIAIFIAPAVLVLGAIAAVGVYRSKPASQTPATITAPNDTAAIAPPLVVPIEPPAAPSAIIVNAAAPSASASGSAAPALPLASAAGPQIRVPKSPATTGAHTSAPSETEPKKPRLGGITIQE